MCSRERYHTHLHKLIIYVNVRKLEEQQQPNLSPLDEFDYMDQMMSYGFTYSFSQFSSVCIDQATFHPIYSPCWGF